MCIWGGGGGGVYFNYFFISVLFNSLNISFTIFSDVVSFTCLMLK